MLEDYCMYLRTNQWNFKKHIYYLWVRCTHQWAMVKFCWFILIYVGLKDIDHIVRLKPCYEKISINEFCLVELRKKYLLIQDLKKGLTVSAILCICSTQSRLGNYHFLWRIPDGIEMEASTPENVCQLTHIVHTILVLLDKNF